MTPFETMSSIALGRPTRERRQAQRFGFSNPRNDSLQDSKETTNNKHQTIEEPSLIVKLPLSSTVPPCKKRGAESLDFEDDAEFKANSAIRARASKRQKLPLVRQEDKVDRPQPRDEPQVWAEGRQALSESLPYYQAFHSAAYTWGSVPGFAGFTYGYLLDNDNEEYGYMDEKVVITRLGGGMKASKEKNRMEQTEDQDSSSHRVASLVNNQREQLPVVLIVGAKNAHCPVKVPHRYNVLGYYQVTDVWSEKVKGRVICRARFEMINLRDPSWCGIKGAPLPPLTPDFTTRALVQTCSACDQSSKQIFAAEWTCLNKTCKKFSKVKGTAQARQWNPDFINERSNWLAKVKAPLKVKPPPPTAPLDGTLMETSLKAWKGMVCPKCGRCNSRHKWDEWKCQTIGCDFEIPIQYHVIPASELAPDHAFEAEGHSIPFDKFMEPVVRTESGFHGYWRKLTFEISPGNFISHYLANQVINRQPGGANEILESLQGEKLGMQRFRMGSCAIEGEMITKHFGMNFGLPYKYIVAIDSRSFSEAPSPIINALNHLTWAGKDAITDGSYRPFNELLCLGYMEKQAIGWHDDGEKDLGPDIASLSLGGAASMTFRMKAKYWLAQSLTPETYDPELPVRTGTQAYKLRNAANEHFKAGRLADYKAAKKELFHGKKSEAKKKNAPTVLTLELKHGDMVVMHGADIQKFYEHSVTPKGKLRYGLTGRYIKPENIPVKEHWKGDFEIAPDKVYDGDLALFNAHYPPEGKGA